ncbi:Bacterial extracellular solute-binding protein, family 5 Middle [Holospora curviuscula]|uniref:Bacterial extracellular solute-binding protein, family 5 Middle n=2 Tax=Holospora curviuscula TaxID=1082868 RepID=A0A2S5RDP9_9PROT|nr:Bacterial extracellular solute-binding protein, family 5 Middle [Holospora curviuscula]
MRKKLNKAVFYCATISMSNLGGSAKKITESIKKETRDTVGDMCTLNPVPINFQETSSFFKKSFEEGTNFTMYRVDHTFHAQRLVNPRAPKGGLIRLAMVAPSFTSLDPFVSISVPPGLYSAYVPGMAISSLMMRCWECPFHMIPYCAQKIRKAKDNSWITFYLDPNARFHDGRPITAQDVLATFNYFCRYGSAHRKRIGTKISRISVENTRTITFYIAPIEEKSGCSPRYDPEFPLVIAGLPVLSEEDLRHRNGVENLMNPLMGSGPYRLRQHTDHVTIYERVPDFWGKNLPQFQGIANADTLHYRRFLTKEAAFAAFRRGEVDVWIEDNPHQWENYASFPAQGSSIKIHKIIHNEPIGMMGFFLNSKRPLFRDIRVRQGISAILNLKFLDFQRILGKQSCRIRSFFQGTPYAALEPLSPEEQALLLTLPLPLTDIFGPTLQSKKAISDHFKISGWRLKNNLLQKDGVPMSFTITVKRKEEKVWAGRFSIYLKDFGIDAQVKEVDETAYYQKISQKDFDVVVEERRISNSPGAEQVYYWTSEHAGPQGKNYSCIQDPNVDFACQNMMLSLNNQKKYELWLRILDRILKRGCYVLPLHYYTTKIIAHWKHIGIPDPIHHIPDSSPVTSYWSIFQTHP